MWMAPGGRRTIAVLAALLACASLSLARPAPASAHAFLISSNPQPGARLGRAPKQLTMDFSEAVVSSAVRISAHNGAGARIPLPHPAAHGRVVVQPLPRALRGVYVVSWQVVSADDGHLTDGELAFAVGTNAALPKISAAPEVACITPPRIFADTRRMRSIWQYSGTALARSSLAAPA